MELSQLNSQKTNLLSSISQQQSQLAALQLKRQRLIQAKGQFVNNIGSIRENHEQFKSLEVNDSLWKGKTATTFKSTYEQQVILNLGRFIGELDRVKEDIEHAIQQIERQIDSCESSISSLNRSFSIVNDNIQIEKQKKENG
ncbi:hypothetical protein BACCIP111899_03730 [Bacillus rhizoplanae]|uniref:DUF5082 domain-containing protein n=1 Tax=Bacillus rhizoplanae TaxID=2880966 RepID=A0ABM8YF85_9BACI|nr:DUF5082 family protein [Bacillus rhizoplanae]CAG9614497.1 hypothetical protein BACCIP111899_03730 [Bacillus rhizoplanae]